MQPSTAVFFSQTACKAGENRNCKVAPSPLTDKLCCGSFAGGEPVRSRNGCAPCCKGISMRGLRSDGVYLGKATKTNTPLHPTFLSSCTPPTSPWGGGLTSTRIPPYRSGRRYPCLRRPACRASRSLASCRASCRTLHPCECSLSCAEVDCCFRCVFCHGVVPRLLSGCPRTFSSLFLLVVDQRGRIKSGGGVYVCVRLFSRHGFSEEDMSILWCPENGGRTYSCISACGRMAAHRSGKCLSRGAVVSLCGHTCAFSSEFRLV